MIVGVPNRLTIGPTLVQAYLIECLITFSVSRRRREMYIGHARLCVCLSVPRRIPRLLHGPECKLRNGKEYPLVVQYWANLQSVHGFRCFAEREMSASACILDLCLVIFCADNY